MKTRFLIISGIMMSCVLFITPAYAVETFDGKASFERVPKVIISDVPNEFEIKFHYVGEPYVLYNLTPIININPESAIPFVQIETISSELQPSVPGRIPVVITVDKNIPHQKIFLSVSYEALGYGDKPYKSSWSDFLTLEIGDNQDYTVVETPKLPERTCKEEYVLIYRYNKTPACVTYQTGQKLVERGWATCDDGINHDRGHPCGPHSSPVISFDSYKTEPDFDPQPEPERTSDAKMQLYVARKSLQNTYQNHVNLGPYYMKDVVRGFGTYDDTLIVDIASKYTDSDSFQIVKQEIQHIVGNDINVDYVVYDEPIERHIETVIPYLWNRILHQNKIDFTPKEQDYWNDADGFAEHDKVCSPLVASNGTEFFISSTFEFEPFEVTGTYIDKTQPYGCHKIWKTEVIMQEPDRVTALWLENEN